MLIRTVDPHASLFVHHFHAIRWRASVQGARLTDRSSKSHSDGPRCCCPDFNVMPAKPVAHRVRGPIVLRVGPLNWSQGIAGR
jgi:hypothetical protein